MSIVSTSSEVVQRDGFFEDTRNVLVRSELDSEVPSSPLGASACKLEDSDNKRVKPSDYVEQISSPGLSSDRKRKKTKQVYL
jgi:hypothetical protein